MSQALSTSEVKADINDLELGKGEAANAASAVADCNITEHKCSIEELCALEHIQTDPVKGLSKAGE